MATLGPEILARRAASGDKDTNPRRPALMTRPILLAVLVVTLCVVVGALPSARSAQGSAPAAKNRAFVNGRIFDGQRFVRKPLFVTADGEFSRTRPSGAEIVD